MHDDDPRLLKLARSITDGVHVDWDQMEKDAGEGEERDLVEALRALAHIAWFHRLQQLAAGGAAASPAPVRASGPPGEARVAGGREKRAGRDIPRRWGHLEIRSKLGEGVFGEVYLAWETTLHREVALKLLRADVAIVAAKSGGLAPQLLQEGRNLARLRHPNVVHVYGAEQYEGRVGIWMEYVRGRTLETVLQDQGPFGAREATLIGIDLCRALTAVHQAGLVHRDLKANNVMREEGGRIVLMDFGAGLDLESAPAGSIRGPAGTPVYLAPEIFQGRQASVASDLYSLGVLMYHLVTGKFPVDGESLREIALVHERGAARLLREERSDLTQAFVQAVERTLDRDPAARFPSAGQLERALAAALI